MRQLARTVTDQTPRKSPFSGQPVAGEVERLWQRGAIQTAKDVLHRFQQIRAYPAAVVACIEPLEAAVLEAPNH
jgi:hypothetical protein